MQGLVRMSAKKTQEDLYRREMVKQLREKHGAALGQYILAKVKDQAVAQDIEQHVFERCLDNPKVHEKTDLPYLFAIAKNRIVDGYRRDQRWRMAPINSDDDTLTSPALQVSSIEWLERDMDLQHLMNQLAQSAPRDHAVLVLLLEGASGPEVQRKLGINHQAVMYRQRQGIKRLKQLYAQHANEEGKS
jgi:DNA-directed RNA polymerase specialized sigma24 family protein